MAPAESDHAPARPAWLAGPHDPGLPRCRRGGLEQSGYLHDGPCFVRLRDWRGLTAVSRSECPGCCWFRSTCLIL